MYEYGGAPTREHQIRPPGQIFAVQAETKAESVQPAPQQEFRLRVLAADAAHVVPTLRRREYVHHGGSQAPIASATTPFSASAMSVTLMLGRRVMAPNRKLRRYSGWNSRAGI